MALATQGWRHSAPTKERPVMSEPDELPPVKVRLNGLELWWQKNADGSGALAPLEHCDAEGNVEAFLELSYAHVFADGAILRHNCQIGHRDDLEIVV